ncbi:MAG: N-acetylmuramoyl-L-alanine amidase [Moorea sp. SIO2B7]|nr:N-acetylmuramoyl-L-alanine amidase [Moorena sp. SIO2B7]
MNKIIELTAVTALTIGSITFAPPVTAQTKQPLFLAYPPKVHQTKAERIFLIGTASPSGEVLINGEAIQRSQAGHFAPSFPLQMGENRFVLRYGKEEITVKITRISTEPEIPVGVAFAKNSLTPSKDIARLPDELICFGAIAPPNGKVSVRLGNQNIPLLPQPQSVNLPLNNAVLTSNNRPTSSSVTSQYQGCTTVSEVGNLGNPIFQLNLNGKTVIQEGSGKVEILSVTSPEVIEVTAEAGVARTGPSTNYSRMTPLPKGTKAAVTGKEGDWLRLDYGGWIHKEESQTLVTKIPPKSLIRSIISQQVIGATEIIFPLQTPVPVSVNQGDKTFTLTLYNTTAQTDTIRINDDPIIKRLDWQQINPTQIQYTFHLKSEQQWGYDLKYEGTSLILSLRHPPKVESQSLSGIKILLDPGHGGKQLGARGPTGYPEKDVNLLVSKLLQKEFKKRGAIVYLTRETDKELSLDERVTMINKLKPTLALSIHYNALPDNGDAINTAGISTFWYNSQAHNLSVFLHNYLVEKLNRPSHGVFWNNLALTRPHTAPCVLLELGFMINPEEFEWIINPQEQQKLASAIADGIKEWFEKFQS